MTGIKEGGGRNNQTKQDVRKIKKENDVRENKRKMLKEKTKKKKQEKKTTLPGLQPGIPWLVVRAGGIESKKQKEKIDEQKENEKTKT